MGYVLTMRPETLKRFPGCRTKTGFFSSTRQLLFPPVAPLHRRAPWGTGGEAHHRNGQRPTIGILVTAQGPKQLNLNNTIQKIDHIIN